MVATLVLEASAEMRESSSLSSRTKVYSLIAQSVERRTVNPQVGGSSPPRGAKLL